MDGGLPEGIAASAFQKPQVAEEQQLNIVEKSGLLKVALVIVWILIVVQIILLGVIAYWQIMDADNLTYKAWLKGIMHLETFDSMGFAIAVFVVLTLVQVVALYLYTFWVAAKDKKAYYVIAGLLLLGIWTYMLLPAVVLLALMFPKDSRAWFGMESMEDLF
jgi:magnesium-transporting ATPase (P-type)